MLFDLQFLLVRDLWENCLKIAELKAVVYYSNTFFTILQVWVKFVLPDWLKIDLDIVWRFSLMKIKGFLHCKGF